MSDDITILGDNSMGRHVPDFVVCNRHTVYEWAMIYADLHPGILIPQHNSATVEHRNARLTMLGATGQGDALRRRPSLRIINAVYRELAARIAAGQIEPRKRVYLDDWPAEIDDTLYEIDAGPVLELAQRRGDCGAVIAELSAAQKRGAAEAMTDSANQAILQRQHRADADNFLQSRAGTRTNKAKKAEEECEELLRDQVTQWRLGQQERPRKEDARSASKAAAQEPARLSDAAFNRAWAKIAPLEWKGGGAPKRAHKNR